MRLQEGHKVSDFSYTVSGSVALIKPETETALGLVQLLPQRVVPRIGQCIIIETDGLQRILNLIYKKGMSAKQN